TRRCDRPSSRIWSPIAGWIANHLGPRWASGVGAASDFGALGYLTRHRSPAGDPISSSLPVHTDLGI
ncbi:hypothetical protein, partial [Burkholderia pseudomallei]|uniref:hypothetical protein n=1 Tax=Burkholderia pseudomallei TaxID=28450 RepID=UPI00126708B0